MVTDRDPRSYKGDEPGRAARTTAPNDYGVASSRTRTRPVEMAEGTILLCNPLNVFA